MKKSLAACSWCSCSILSSTSASWERARDRAVLSSEFPSMAKLLANTAVFPHSSGVESGNRKYIQTACFKTRQQDWDVFLPEMQQFNLINCAKISTREWKQVELTLPVIDEGVDHHVKLPELLLLILHLLELVFKPLRQRKNNINITIVSRMVHLFVFP